MSSVEGSDAVYVALLHLRCKIEDGDITRATLESDVTKMIVEVSREYPEVGTSQVRDAIYAEVDNWCERRGWPLLYA